MAEADWLRLQKVVFARYVQQKLRESDREEFRQIEVKNVVEEMKSSILLVNLMEVMSGTKKAKPLKEETMRIKMITNANEALDFVTSCGVDLKLVRAQAEDIVDGVEKVVMALIFQIIIKYLKFDEDGEEGKSESVDVREALSLWLKNKVDGYENVPDVSLQKKKIPTKAFHDGMVFNALVHKMRPKLVDFGSLSPENGIANLNNALDLAEKYLNIEKYVTAEDITKMDELSIIVYLSDWFNGVILLQKQDIAARRVGKLVDLTILHDKLRAQYTEEATQVRDWLASKTAELNKREFDDTLGGIKAKLEAFYNYKGTEKGVWVGKKLDCTGLFNNLQARLANHKRPIWAPPEGTAPTDLDKAFDDLAEVEIKRSIDLNAELARQLKLHKMYKRFQSNSTKLEAWLGEKQAYAAAREAIDSVDAGDDALEELGIQEKEQAHVSSSQLTDIVAIGEELVQERFEHSADVTSASASLKSKFDGLTAAVAEKKGFLEAELQKQKDLNDQLCKAFADAANAFQASIKEKRNVMAGETQGDLETQLAAVNAQMSDTKTAEDTLADIDAKDAAVQARGIGLNPHSNLTAGDLRAEWAQYQVLLQKKKELLEEQIVEASRGGLTPEQAAEIDANFSYFDKDGNGFLTKKELRVCLQSLGEESRPNDIAKIMELYDTDKSETIKKDEFVQYMKANLGDSGTVEEMIKAFKYLCYSKEFILKQELVNVVNDKGFKDHHVEYLEKEMQPSGDGFAYGPWTEAAFAR